MSKKPQIQKFRETARRADPSEAAFNRALKKVTNPPPKESKPQPKKPAR